ncbi:hypothetical protein ACHAWF_003003, partial [Thalassiosira exigua]
TCRRLRVSDALACLPTPSQAVAVAVYCRLRSRSIATEAGPERHLVKVLLEVVQKRNGGSSRHQRRSRSQSVAPTAHVSMRRRLAGCMHRVLICLILPSISLAMGTTSRVARAAIAQLRSTRDKHSNLLNVAKCAGWAKRDGAKMLFLPECFGFMGDNADHTLNQADPPIEGFVGVKAPPTPTPFRRALAETIESVSRTGGYGIDDEGASTYSEADAEPIVSIVEELSFIAREADIWISGGGVHTVSETSSDTTTSGQSKIYNTHVVIDQHGQIKAYYHKIHLFDVSIPGKVSLQESKTTSPGNELVVVDSPVGKLGLTICYDLRFSEMYVDLVQKMGAEVLLVPSAFTVPTGKAHWHALLRGELSPCQNVLFRYFVLKWSPNFFRPPKLVQSRVSVMS